MFVVPFVTIETDFVFPFSPQCRGFLTQDCCILPGMGPQSICSKLIIVWLSLWQLQIYWLQNNLHIYYVFKGRLLSSLARFFEWQIAFEVAGISLVVLAFLINNKFLSPYCRFFWRRISVSFQGWKNWSFLFNNFGMSWSWSTLNCWYFDLCSYLLELKPL